MSSKYSAVLFDLDGTIVDSAPTILHALNQALIKFDQPPTSLDAVKVEISAGTTAIIKHTTKLDPTTELFQNIRSECLNNYFANITQDTSLYQGMELILQLLAEHNIPWGIVTNKTEDLSFKLLKELDIYHKAGCIIAQDTTAFQKPSPEPLIHAAKQLTVAPEKCMYIGDAITDIQAAKSAQMLAILAAYGYIKSLDDTKNWGADHTVVNCEQLMEYIKRLCII